MELTAREDAGCCGFKQTSKFCQIARGLSERMPKEATELSHGAVLWRKLKEGKVEGRGGNLRGVVAAARI
jgi:hypothetical protein